MCEAFFPPAALWSTVAFCVASCAVPSRCLICCSTFASLSVPVCVIEQLCAAPSCWWQCALFAASVCTTLQSASEHSNTFCAPAGPSCTARVDLVQVHPRPGQCGPA